MTPQKFKPGDKVGIVKTDCMYLDKKGNQYKTTPPSEVYTVRDYRGWNGKLGWAVWLEELGPSIDEALLVPVLPDEALAELLEETIQEPVIKQSVFSRI